MGRENALLSGLDDLLGDFFDADDVQIFPRQQLMHRRDGKYSVQRLGQYLLDRALADIVHLQS